MHTHIHTRTPTRGAFAYPRLRRGDVYTPIDNDKLITIIC